MSLHINRKIMRAIEEFEKVLITFIVANDSNAKK